jgi:hypothetical protein
VSLKERMKQTEQNDRIREATAMKLYKNDKTFRADRLVSAWSKVPKLSWAL